LVLPGRLFSYGWPFYGLYYKGTFSKGGAYPISDILSIAQA
jgi:hypothetical protein